MRTITLALLIAASVACNKPDPAADASKSGTPSGTRTDAKPGTDAPGTDTPNAPPALIKPPPVISGGAADRLVPGDAALLAHIDMQGLAGSPLWAANKAILDADPEFTKQMNSFAACNMPFSGLRGLDIGVGSDGQELVLVVSGGGVGKPDNLRCLQARLNTGDMKLEEQDGTTRVVFAGGERFGHPAGDDAIVITTRAWSDAVLGLIAGKGSSVRDGGLKDILAAADQSKHIWFAGRLPPELAALASAGVAGMAGLRSVAGSLDLSAGLGLTLAFGMDSPEKAKATLGEVQTQFDTVKPLAGLFGVPQSAVDKVKFTASDASVVMTAALTMDEINALSAALNQLNAAGSEEPAQPPAPPEPPVQPKQPKQPIAPPPT